MAKIDKQALIKQHFWILLGLFIPLAMMVVVFVMTGVASEISARKEKIDKSFKDQKASTNPKSRNYLDELEKQKTALNKQRTEVWALVWENQKDLFRWPEPMREMNDRYWGSDLEDTALDRFRKDSVYLAAVEEMAKSIEPTRYNGGWQNVIRHVATWEKFPSKEDVWLALEDFWVQRELLRVISTTNALTSRFKAVDEKIAVDPSKGELFRRKFKSRLWDLDLSLSKRDRDYFLSGTITNISGVRQVFGLSGRMDLKVWLYDPSSRAEPVRLPVEEEVVPDGKKVVIREFKVQNVGTEPKGLEQVEQQFDLRTVPVKRIDKIALGYHSSRTSTTPLKPPTFIPQGEPPTAGAPGSEGGPGGPPTGAPPPMPMTPGFGIPGDISGQPPQNVSPNGLVRERYMAVTPQVRRMPVGMLLICDQTAVPDVLASLSNSPLRIQVTQVHWQRFTGQLSPDDGVVKPANPMASIPGSGATPMPMGPAGKAGGPTGGRFRFPVGGGTGSTASGGDDQLVPTLVELAVYGVCSIHERYPPRNQAGEDQVPMENGPKGPAGGPPPTAPGAPPKLPGAPPAVPGVPLPPMGAPPTVPGA